MKILIVLIFLVSFNAFSSEVFFCKQISAFLIKNNESEFILKTKRSEIGCSVSYTTLPGTEVELKVLECAKKQYYFTNLNENTVVLTKNTVWSKDIYCEKQNLY